jgi:hypothetical protein
MVLPHPLLCCIPYVLARGLKGIKLFEILPDLHKTFQPRIRSRPDLHDVVQEILTRCTHPRLRSKIGSTLCAFAQDVAVSRAECTYTVYTIEPHEPYTTVEIC